MKKTKYVPSTCTHCNQTTTYLLPIDKGTVQIIRAISKYIGRKGINVVHPRKEMEGINLTSNEVGNLSRPRFHGLIARVKGEKGNYLLTKKGADFLNRKTKIDKYAIISKETGHNIGYFEPGQHLVSVDDFIDSNEFWEGTGYDIVSGRVITENDLFNSVNV